MKNTEKVYDPNYDVVISKKEFYKSIDEIIKLTKENAELKAKLDLANKVMEDLANESVQTAS